jgi:hypothetical protein
MNYFSISDASAEAAAQVGIDPLRLIAAQPASIIDALTTAAGPS